MSEKNIEIEKYEKTEHRIVLEDDWGFDLGALDKAQLEHMRNNLEEWANEEPESYDDDEKQKVLTREKHGQSSLVEEGMRAIDRNNEAFQDDLRDKGYNEEDIVEKSRKEKLDNLRQLKNDLFNI